MKVYCRKCKKMLEQVLSSFECLATWDKDEKYYAPGNECNLVKRCPDCGNLTEEKEKRIGKRIGKRLEMEIKEKVVRHKPSFSKSRPREPHPRA